MQALIRCDPMPDEPVWGHFRRVVVANGLVKGRELVRQIEPLQQPRERFCTRVEDMVPRFLAGTALRRDLWTYFRCHSIYTALFATPEFIADEQGVALDWQALLSRWHLHPAPILSSLRVARRCPSCQQDDRSVHGFYWFRRFHQLPGVDWCPVHERFLEEATLRFNLAFEPLRFRALEAPSQSKRARAFVGRYIDALQWLCEAGLRQRRPRLEKWVQSRAGRLQSFHARYVVERFDCAEWLVHHFRPPVRFALGFPPPARRFSHPCMALQFAELTRTQAQGRNVLAALDAEEAAAHARFWARAKRNEPSGTAQPPPTPQDN